MEKILYLSLQVQAVPYLSLRNLFSLFATEKPLLYLPPTQTFIPYMQWRMQDGNKWRLNNEDLGLELEINDDLRLSNRGQMKKSGSLGVL